MAEWSKAPANSPREQGGVGSKPAPAKKLVFALFLSFFDHSARSALTIALHTIVKSALFKIDTLEFIGRTK